MIKSVRCFPHAAPLTGLLPADLSLPTVASASERRLYISSQLGLSEAGSRSDWSHSEGAVFTPGHTYLTSLKCKRACLLSGPASNVVPHVDSHAFCH